MLFLKMLDECKNASHAKALLLEYFLNHFALSNFINLVQPSLNQTFRVGFIDIG